MILDNLNFGRKLFKDVPFESVMASVRPEAAPEVVDIDVPPVLVPLWRDVNLRQDRAKQSERLFGDNLSPSASLLYRRHEYPARKPVSEGRRVGL